MDVALLNLHWREQTPFTTVKLELPVTHTHDHVNADRPVPDPRCIRTWGPPWALAPPTESAPQGYPPRRALVPLQRPLGVAATGRSAHRAVQSHLANREELLQAGSAHEVGAR